jgi:ATP-dependent Lhr-like helicase
MTVDLLHPTIAHHLVNSLQWSSLRPLQAEAVEPLIRGYDALLLAPTAGGKTEAAAFPLLTAMANQRWPGLSLLYVCPLKALLNNLEPRLASYASWIGRSVGLWHGDVSTARRGALNRQPPNILLTTPESLESALVSTKVDTHEFFRGVRAIVVDEVHAFAGDDRGWHLLSVLERVERLAGHRIQRVGLSATVGNPQDLLRWLQGSGEERHGVVVAPDVQIGSRADADIVLDDVSGDGPAEGTANAAKVIAALHAGEKRLVFCESRRAVETLSSALRVRGVETYVSHSSLSLDERRRAEKAFAESRDCVIVSTSTLELGIDVGDLDRMIQIDAPASVASFLQRLGRTGRRMGSSRNALLLATTPSALLHGAGLLHLWSQGFVEPVKPPPDPAHVMAQQLMALCLQEGQVGEATWPEWWGRAVPPGAQDASIADWLVETGHLERDGGMLFVGPETEKRYGRRHFMELLSVFTAAPEVAVWAGREHIGTVSPVALTCRVAGPRIVLLAGKAWRVTAIDWRRRRCFVEPGDGGGHASWRSMSVPLLGSDLSQAQREVLLGSEPDVQLSRRAVAGLAALRDSMRHTVHPRGSVVLRDDGLRWWTWAGARSNLTLMARLQSVAEPSARLDNYAIRLRQDLSTSEVESALQAANDDSSLPEVSDDALKGLKFSEMLPASQARATLARRLVDEQGVRAALQPRSYTSLLE